MNLGDIPQKQPSGTASFFKAAVDTHLKPGESCTFTCPICGATAIAKSSPNNGHLHANCTGCGCAVIQ